MSTVQQPRSSSVGQTGQVPVTASAALSGAKGGETEQRAGATVDKSVLINGVDGDPRQLGFLIHHLKKPALQGGASMGVESDMNLGFSQSSASGGSRGGGSGMFMILIAGISLFIFTQVL